MMFRFCLGAIFQIPALNSGCVTYPLPFCSMEKGIFPYSVATVRLMSLLIPIWLKVSSCIFPNDLFHPGDGRRSPHPHPIVEMSFSMFAWFCLMIAALACPTRCVAKMINEMSNGIGWISREERPQCAADR